MTLTYIWTGFFIVGFIAALAQWLIGGDTEDSLGIKYNLGLAHEMIGDLANARTFFEDVYVVDVTFRDVAEKVRKLAATP